jgi:hypothetical protein
MEVPPKKEDLPDGFILIKCDAGYKNRSTGLCISTETNKRNYKERLLKRCCRGPVHAELKAIHLALIRANSLSNHFHHCLIYNDNLYAHFFVRGIWIPARPYILEVVSAINKEKLKLEEKGVSVLLFKAPAKYVKKIDKRAKKARLEREDEKSKQIAERKRSVIATIERSKGIAITITDEGMFALSSDRNKQYRVSIRPLFCECPAWQKKWGNKEPAAVYARALPCKHLCALCSEVNLDVFKVFSKPIFRLD